jgi:hemerythrin-like domain-containing protein
MKITDAFLGEHAVFYAQFDHLEAKIPAMNSLEQVKIQGAMVEAGLKGHAGLEEELLFKTLEPLIGPMGPLAVMRAEHEEIERSLHVLPGVQELAQAQHLLLQVIAIAREHFAKEEQILYPTALQTLSAEELSELGKQWAEKRQVFLA